MEILGCRPYHRWAANIDVFDDLFEIHTCFGGGLLERIKIHHDHVDGRDPVLLDCSAVRSDLATVEDAPVHLWMKCFHPAVEHLWESGQVGDVAHRDPLL